MALSAATHGPGQIPPTSFSSRLVGGSLQVAAGPCWEMVLPDVISVGPSLDAWPPTPVGSHGALTRFFPWEHRPSPNYDRVGFPTNIPYSGFSTGQPFGAAGIPLCSGL